MTISSLYHTQGIFNYKLQCTQRVGYHEIYLLHSTKTTACCPKCQSYNTKLVKTGQTRDIKGHFIGMKQTIMRVFTRRIKCSNCNSSSIEPICFCPKSHVKYTRHLARFVIALRKEMSISAVAKFTGLHWESVKNIEKDFLAKKYKRVRLNDVEYLGIDEVYLGKVMGYITVVRDLQSGTVLFIGEGKGSDALNKFTKRIKSKAKQIKAVAIDMANSYSSWVKKYCQKLILFLITFML